jgi:putative nucleotidyltransferase with HDIG domain
MENSIYSIPKLKELARRLDRDNNYTLCHSENVANLALEVCRALGIRGKKKDMIIAACLIHDIGKVAVEPAVLAKRDKLSIAESIKMKMHPIISARLASQAGLHKSVVEIIYYHHVWFNGNGYPDNVRKKGKRIPIGARIMAVCDAYDTMISNRSYKEEITKEDAIEELQKFSVKQFDPTIVEVFIRILKL